MSESPDRRNPLRLIVSKETQLRILWLVAGGIFFTTAMAIVAAFWLKELVWTIVVCLSIGAFVSLWISRRIAGPFYRIERDLENLLNGALSGQEIRLRPGDPLQHLADLINILIERTRAKDFMHGKSERPD